MGILSLIKRKKAEFRRAQVQSRRDYKTNVQIQKEAHERYMKQREHEELRVARETAKIEANAKLEKIKANAGKTRLQRFGQGLASAMKKVKSDTADMKKQGFLKGPQFGAASPAQTTRKLGKLDSVNAGSQGNFGGQRNLDFGGSSGSPFGGPPAREVQPQAKPKKVVTRFY